MLKSITLLRDRVSDWNVYPFSVSTIQNLERLDLHSRVCFFSGENGTGKSTLLEAIAVHYGFGREGGGRNFRSDSTESNHSIDPLVRALRLSFNKRTGAGFFLRAESMFSTFSYIDELDREPLGPRIIDYYGGSSLHDHSHGEAFFTVFEHKFQRNGLFLLDEPEAALSPQRQLAFMVMIHDVMKKCRDAQFIISSHSPVLLGYPGAQIFSFDDGAIREIQYDDTIPARVLKRFMSSRESFLDELFTEPPSLFDQENGEDI